MSPFNIPIPPGEDNNSPGFFCAESIKKVGIPPTLRTFNIKPGTLANSPQSTARHIKIAHSV